MTTPDLMTGIESRVHLIASAALALSTLILAMNAPRWISALGCLTFLTLAFIVGYDARDKQGGDGQ